MQFRAKQIAPPKDWSAFEDLCHALFKHVWNDPIAQKNGRRGQKQHGVDVFGSLNGDRSSFQGVQCKGKDTNYGSKVELPEVVTEIAKAERFVPCLKHWIFATTAPADAPLQKSARELSVERKKKGLFSVDVLGWEEIQALMADAPEVIREFYPEHSDYIPVVIEALRTLPSIEAKLNGLVDRIAENVGTQPKPAIWESIAFDNDRGLGPALMGRPLGPADVAACPRLVEADSLLSQLRIASSARVVGEPGSGKSICSYQVASELAASGYEVVRLVDPQSEAVQLKSSGTNSRRLYLIDDAHLMPPRLLGRLEDQAGPGRLVLSTHNAIARWDEHRGSVSLDAKRAVKTIAAAFRADLPRTLSAVRLADDHVGERMMDADLRQRIDHAEHAADRPWQFCFILGGGWRRSTQAADAARSADADFVLAAVAMRQLATRDARATASDIEEICVRVGIEGAVVGRALTWLEGQRLLLGSADCRCPHQRFASVVLKRILEGRDTDGRLLIGRMIDGLLCDSRYPFAGVRSLLHELRFGSGGYSWRWLLQESTVQTLAKRCWLAEGEERGFAALALSELWDFTKGGATAIVGQMSRCWRSGFQTRMTAPTGSVTYSIVSTSRIARSHRPRSPLQTRSPSPTPIRTRAPRPHTGSPIL